MFSLCTSAKLRFLPFFLFAAMLTSARAQAPATPAAPVTDPAPAAPAATPAAPAPSAPEAQEPEEKPGKDKAGPVLRVLPEGLDPNPPNPDDLKAQHLVWKGEYEATKDGQPVLGPDARPIPALYNAKGKRVKSRVKPLHSHPLSVVAGTLTVDGWTGKARLNYDIPGQDFIYFSTPSIGTVIVSQTAFPGSREQKLALDGKTLTIHISDRDIQLASDKVLSGKKPESVWVRLDPDYREDPRYPVMGFGPVTKPPYAWPPSKNAETKGAIGAPPLPQSMMPAVVAAVCIAQPGKPCPPAARPAVAAKPAVPPQGAPAAAVASPAAQQPQ